MATLATHSSYAEQSANPALDTGVLLCEGYLRKMRGWGQVGLPYVHHLSRPYHPHAVAIIHSVRERTG
jgi:hypothetical protein